MDDDRLREARDCYERAVFFDDADARAAGDRALDGVEADLCLARGRLLHARFLADLEETPSEGDLFARAIELYAALGDRRGEAEALFWLGCYHQVIRQDTAAAVPSFERSYELATEVDDRMTMSYAVRHLGFAAMASRRLDLARERLEESLRLRRELGHQPAIAAAALAVAEVAAESDDREAARRYLDEATAIATEAGADGVLRWVDRARADIAASA